MMQFIYLQLDKQSSFNLDRQNYLMALDKPYITSTKIATSPNNSLGWYHHVAIPDGISAQAYDNNARRISM